VKKTFWAVIVMTLADAVALADKRFWPRVRKGHDCWEWCGTTTEDGYGWVVGRPFQILAHRLSWIVANQRLIPDELCICHHCDNRICVRPDHLFLGTRGDNMRDMRAKGRAARQLGELHGQAKLKSDEVRALRALYQSGHIGTKAMSKLFGISETETRRIISYERWAHL
jgi:hypothetical protein